MTVDPMRGRQTRSPNQVLDAARKKQADTQLLLEKLRKSRTILDEQVQVTVSLKNSCMDSVQDISQEWAKAIRRL